MAENNNMPILIRKKNEEWNFYKKTENSTIKSYILNKPTGNITKQHELMFVVLSARCFLINMSIQLNNNLTNIQNYLDLPINKAYNKNYILSKLKIKKDLFERENEKIEAEVNILNEEKIIKLSELEEVKFKVKAENDKKDELEKKKTNLFTKSEETKKEIEGYRSEIKIIKEKLKVQQNEDDKIQAETGSIKNECDILRKEINEKTVEVGQIEEIISHGDNIDYDGEKYPLTKH